MMNDFPRGGQEPREPFDFFNQPGAPVDPQDELFGDNHDTQRGQPTPLDAQSVGIVHHPDRQRHPRRTVAVVTAAALAVGGYFVVTSGGNKQPVAPPVASASPNPGEVSPSAEPEPSQEPTPEESSPESTTTSKPDSRFGSPDDYSFHENVKVLSESYSPAVKGVAALERLAGKAKDKPQVKMVAGLMIVPTIADSPDNVTTDPNSEFGWVPASVFQTEQAGFTDKIGSPNLITVIQPSRRSINSYLTPEGEETTRAQYREWKAAGLTGESLGVAVVAPEMLVGGWDGVDGETAAQYADIVNDQVRILREEFSDASPSTMIDSHELKDLQPVLGDINAAELGSQGYQIFKGPDEEYIFERGANGKLQLTNAAELFNAKALVKAAKTIGLDTPVWLNVGFGDVDNTIEERTAIIQAYQAQIQNLAMQGLNIGAVNGYFAAAKVTSYRVEEPEVAAAIYDATRSLNALGMAFYAEAA